MQEENAILTARLAELEARVKELEDKYKRLNTDAVGTREIKSFGLSSPNVYPQ